MTGEDVVCRSFTAPSCIKPAHDGKHSHDDLCIGAEVVLKLVNLSLEKMRSIVVWLLLLSVLEAVTSIGVDGDSNCKEATLAATMETNLAQLKSEINGNCCQSNTTGSNFLVIFLSHLFLHFNVRCCIFSWAGQSYSSCKQVYTSHKWVIPCTFSVNLAIIVLHKILTYG